MYENNIDLACIKYDYMYLSFWKKKNV